MTTPFPHLLVLACDILRNITTTSYRIPILNTDISGEGDGRQLVAPCQAALKVVGMSLYPSVGPKLTNNYTTRMTLYQRGGVLNIRSTRFRAL